MTYDLAEHRHRFAVWAAARAAQRGFTSIKRLRGALEATSIRADLRAPDTLALERAGFDEIHLGWCRSICTTLNGWNVQKVAFGRAAKLVAVYLKAMVLMGGDWDTPLARCMHPPLDRILLQALAATSDDAISSPHKGAWRRINWTRLDEAAYYQLIHQMRAVKPPILPFWRIEEYWQPSDAADSAV
jgi:hypothetical protein